MITDQISRVFDGLPYIRLYFCNFPFIFYILRHTFVSEMGTMNLLMLKLSSGETTAGCKCWHRNPFFSSGSQKDSQFLDLSRRENVGTKNLFSSGSQAQTQFANKSNLNIISAHKWPQYNHHPGDHPLVSDDSADLSIFFSPKNEGRAEEWPENQSRTRT